MGEYWWRRRLERKLLELAGQSCVNTKSTGQWLAPCLGDVRIEGVEALLPQQLAKTCGPVRRGGRVVECGGLENRCPFARTGGSNPSLSATIYI